MPLSVEEIKERLRGLQTLEDLKREDFAEEDGWAFALARKFRDKLKPTQLYKVFSRIKSEARRVRGKAAEEFNRERILTLLPILAYSVGRGVLPKDFYDILKICLSKVRTNGDFIRFTEFMEATLAYHKYISEVGKGGRYGA